MSSLLMLLLIIIASATAVASQFVLPSSPTRALVIEQPSASASYITISTPDPIPPRAPNPIGASIAAITDTPITPSASAAAPTTRARNELSAGEITTLSTPGFRIGDENTPIEVLPPAIGNWHETSATPQTNRNTTPSTPDHTFAGPWAAIAADNDNHTTLNLNITVNATTHGNTTETSLNITVTPHSPTWVDVQGERVNGFASTYPTDSHTIRPRDFPSPRLRSNTSMSYNITIRGNITSFNMSVTNMTHTGNATNVGGGMDGWFGSFIPTGTAGNGNGGESTIHANVTGPHMNITIITPNSTTIISPEPNGTITIEGNNTNTKPIKPSSAVALSLSPLCFITVLFVLFVANDV